MGTARVRPETGLMRCVDRDWEISLLLAEREFMRTTRDRLKAGCCIAFGDHGGLRRYAKRVSCPGHDLKTLVPVVRVFVECVE